MINIQNIFCMIIIHFYNCTFSLYFLVFVLSTFYLDNIPYFNSIIFSLGKMIIYIQVYTIQMMRLIIHVLALMHPKPNYSKSMTIRTILTRTPQYYIHNPFLNHDLCLILIIVQLIRHINLKVIYLCTILLVL